MARGHRLNTSIVLAAVHGLSGLFRAVSAVEPITLALFPTLSPSLIGHPASVDVKQHKSQTLEQTHCARFVRSFCFCLMSSDAKSILGTIYKVSLFWIYHS